MPREVDVKSLRLLVVLVLTMLSGLGLAQFDVPQISFDKWQVLEENEEFNAYIARFPSAFKTKHFENDTVQLHVQLPVDKEKPPIVLILHYWGAPSLKVERSLALELNQRGIGAAIMTLPYHLTRTPKGAVSGVMAIQPDPQKLTATMTQSVMDVRRSLDFVQSRSECGPIIGISGTSLGAIVSSLAYAVDDRLQNAAFLLGGIDLGKLIWKSSLMVPVKDELRAKGFNEQKLSKALESIEPAQYFKKPKVGQSFIIRAKYDTVVPPECTDALFEALPQSKLLSIDSGHYGGIFVQEKLLREVANFFESIVEKKSYVPPLRIVSPTVRVGITFEIPSRFEIAAGFDLIKFDKKGKSYASLLLTPKNPVIWVGTDIASGFNAGVGISNRRVGFGLFWSIVL
jgi:cephalosporin-C deacetylase-like acetyl esterase